MYPCQSHSTLGMEKKLFCGLEPDLPKESRFPRSKASPQIRNIVLQHSPKLDVAVVLDAFHVIVCFDQHVRAKMRGTVDPQKKSLSRADANPSFVLRRPYRAIKYKEYITCRDGGHTQSRRSAAISAKSSIFSGDLLLSSRKSA